MIRLILVSALVAVALGSPKIRPRVPMLDGKIVGGSNANIEDVPYQLSLQYYGSHFCGASIISETRALTAAHCTHVAPVSALSIRASSSIRESGGQVVSVRSICQHPNFDFDSLDNDVSVLVLSSAITLGSGAQPVTLAAAGSDVAEGASATVTGWGLLSETGEAGYSIQLQVVQVPRVSDANCKEAYGSSAVTAQMICFGFTAGGKDACGGDSGGPIVTDADGIQVGIVSGGDGCARANYPGTYSKVAALRSHIDSC